MQSDIVITLDGPAGSGKSSVAAHLAKKLGMLHADSGAIYRTLTLAIMEQSGAGATPEEFANIVSSGNIEPRSLGVSIRTEGSDQINLIKEKPQTDSIRTTEVTARIRYVADRREFRDEVNSMLRTMKGVVADGRDMGSVVFPQAAFKFYLEASVETRAARRVAELASRGWNHDLKSISDSIRKRDDEDKNRAYGALVRTEDMILIDTTHLDLEGVLKRILSSLQLQF